MVRVPDQDQQSPGPVTCSSLDVVPGSWKVTHQWEAVRLSGGDWAWWPSSGRALWCLWLCTPGPSSWSGLSSGNGGQTSSPHPSGGLVEPFYAFLQYSSSHQGLPMGLPNLSKFSLPPSVPPSSLGSLVAIARWMSAGRLQVLYLFLTAPLFLCLRWVFQGRHIVLCYLLHAISDPHGFGSRQPLKHVYLMVEVPIFFAGHPVPYQLDSQIHLPWSPALGGPASNYSELTSPLPSTQIQWHVWTSVGGWMGTVQSSNIPSGVLIQK